MERISIEEIKEELSQMDSLKRMTAEDRYYILSESGIPEMIYDRLNISTIEQ